MLPYVKTMACSTKFNSVLVLFRASGDRVWEMVSGGRREGVRTVRSCYWSPRGLDCTETSNKLTNTVQNCHFPRWESGALITGFQPQQWRVFAEGSNSSQLIRPFTVNLQETVYPPANKLRWAKGMSHWVPKMSIANRFLILNLAFKQVLKQVYS